MAESPTSSTTSVDYDPFASPAIARTAPSTEAQREIWLATRNGTEASLAFNESVSYRLRGELDLPALRAALQDLVDRHDALRCTFSADGLTLCVSTSLVLSVPLTDSSGLDADLRERRQAERVAAHVKEPFDLEHGPLVRAEIVRRDPHDHVVILTAHHIVCDGWSFWVLTKDLAALYSARRHGRTPVLAPAESFADFAVAEAVRGRTALTQADEAYWLSRFSDDVPVLDLPTDRPRPAFKTFPSQREDYLLDAALVEQVKKMGARAGSSFFTTLLATFNVLLHRLSGQSDLVVGIPAAGQSAGGHDALVGHCVNVLPLRTRLEPQTRFGELLKAVRTTMLDAYEHQQYTYGTLLQKLPIARDPSRLALVSVIFNIDQALAGEARRFEGLDFEFASNPRHYENFDLFVNAMETGGALRLECQYNSDLFDRATLRRWLGAFESLLRAFVDDPARGVGQAPLLGAEERELLRTWNAATAMDFPATASVHELVALQAARTPERVAILGDGQSLTYEELETRSNQLARRLRAAGVRRDSLVGLCLERTPDLLVGLLGILKAGGGYVPLDPGFPEDRLQFMVEDSGMKLLVIESGLRARIPAGTVQTLILDEEWDQIARESGAPLARDEASATPESIAYVIYTSGSTGRPKGVVVPHRCVVNLVTSVRQTPGMIESDVVLAVTTLSFDIAVSEVILPLVVGASIVIVGRDVAADGERLRQSIERHRVTFIDATPATWRLLLAAGWPGDRRIKGICTGEAMPRDLAEDLVDRLGSLWNGYGPTETTVWSTFHEVKKPLGRILIGRPVGNTQIHILDAHQEPVPVGVVGELWIGGAGVTRGYLNRPELTEERFIKDPFSPEPGARLYRTGDLARYQADGNLECLGRNDFQVKVRGYRIELGEIETALVADASIAQAVVMAREDRPGDVRLVAYLVPRAGARTEADGLRHQLSGRLPEYMIPSHFVALDALPLLPNGKINRKALPAPGPFALEAAADYVLPRTDLERVLAAAWQEALAVPRVSVHDDFFRLGGHSLLAAQMVARLARDHQLAVPLRSVFENPTVASMAAALGDGHPPEDRKPEDPVARIRARADQTEAPLSLMQQRLWFLEQYEPGRVVHNVPSAHRLRGPLDIAALERAFQEMVRRQTALRTVVREEDGTGVQVVRPEVAVIIGLEDFSDLPREEAEKAAAARMEDELVLPFDLARGPLFRLRLFRIAHREHILFFMAHHLVFDGWSFDLLYEEISALYEAYTQGEPGALPELPVTYGDFAAWHREWMQGAELERQLAYWLDLLRGGIAPLDLPSDRPRPPSMSGGGDTIWIEIGEARMAALGVVAQKAGATLFMTLLAAFQAFLYRYTGQTDFNVGTPVRGRSWPEVERIMGFFVNALVLRAKVDPAESFLGLLARVKQRALEAFDHQDVPFERLIQDLNVPRDESRTPLYQAWFSFQDVRSRPRGWGSLGHENIPIFPPTTAQDLGLWFLRTSEKLVGGLNYNTDLFDRATMVRFFDEFQEFLAAISLTPEQAVGTLRVLPAGETEQLRAWNATPMSYPRDQGVHEMVSAQATRTPDRTALEFEGRTLRYSELEAGSNRLARRLRAMGVERGCLVGLAVERSPEMVTALFGILKAGAAYVPLDPGFPRERLSFMVADSGMKALVTTAALQEDLGLPVASVLLLDQAEGEILKESALPLPRDAHSAEAEDRAYVIYTSGSTGKPKGVEVPHRAVANFLTSMRERPGLTEADRLVAVTTLSFDIAVLELLLPLTVGATVVLASRETATDGERLRDLLRESQATVMQATPATWRLLVEAGWQGGSAFKVLVGGEALPREVAEELAKRAGSVWNMYGPTETTVWSTCWKVESPLPGSILIGAPIGNTETHVLDPQMQPVPTGAPGELWIGGDGVSLGYLNRPELTRERFVDDPFRRSPGAKLYRTGDLARWRPDGNLEALGRTDFQVKVRGYRIELGEIESLLARHDGVAQAAVVARPGPGGENRLVGYVVGRSGEAPSSAELRKMLRRELPDYMIPSIFVVLDAFPLTPNGKVDRRALPDPEDLHGEPAVASVPPRTPTEILLAEVWRELLGVSQVAVHDNFFDLGGHSLLTMRAIAAVEKKNGKRLNPREYIFQTLEQIATAYDRFEATGPEAAGLGRRILGSLSGAWLRRRDGPA
jgi:amino acid adenylation domain-containing protein